MVTGKIKFTQNWKSNLKQKKEIRSQTAGIGFQIKCIFLKGQMLPPQKIFFNQAWNLKIVPSSAQFKGIRERPGVKFIETDVVKGQADVRESSSNTSSRGGKGHKGKGLTSSRVVKRKIWCPVRQNRAAKSKDLAG